MELIHDYLIVGAGMAADSAAKAIHGLDAAGSIGIVGAEASPPYQRPALTKALWKGDKSPANIDLATAASGATLYLGRRATGLGCAAHAVMDDHGDVYHYRRLLLATGATPRRLSGVGGERVIHFRTLADYQALRRYAVPGAEIAVIGGGFIGGELAASLCEAGCKITMVFPGEAIGAGRYPEALAAFLSDYYRRHGVALCTGVTVVGGSADNDGVELKLSDGQKLHVDAVAVGIGAAPDTVLAEQAGLHVDHGIIVDAQLRTSDPDIWAAGDVADFYSRTLGQRLRVEHEDAAISMGRQAGRNMTGANADYIAQPFFYSDQFDLGYEAVGLLDTRMRVIEDWRERYREGVVYYLDAGRVRGVLLWNVWDQVDAARALLVEPGPFTAASLRGRLPHKA